MPNIIHMLSFARTSNVIKCQTFWGNFFSHLSRAGKAYF